MPHRAPPSCNGRILATPGISWENPGEVSRNTNTQTPNRVVASKIRSNSTNVTTVLFSPMHPLARLFSGVLVYPIICSIPNKPVIPIYLHSGSTYTPQHSAALLQFVIRWCWNTRKQECGNFNFKRSEKYWRVLCYFTLCN